VTVLRSCHCACEHRNKARVSAGLWQSWDLLPAFGPSAARACAPSSPVRARREFLGDALQCGCHGFPVFPGDKIEAVAQQVNDASLHHRLRKDCGDRLRKAFEAVDHGDQHVLDAAVLQFVHDAQPEFGTFVLFEPKPQDFLGAVGPDAKCNVHRLIAHGSLVADLDPKRIEKDQRVGCFQRTRLPGGDFLEHRIRHRADQVGRDLDAIQIAQMPDDLAGAHAAGVHRNDLVVETQEAPLIFGDQLRVEYDMGFPARVACRCRCARGVITALAAITILQQEPPSLTIVSGLPLATAAHSPSPVSMSEAVLPPDKAREGRGLAASPGPLVQSQGTESQKYSGDAMRRQLSAGLVGALLVSNTPGAMADAILFGGIGGHNVSAGPAASANDGALVY